MELEPKVMKDLQPIIERIEELQMDYDLHHPKPQGYIPQKLAMLKQLIIDIEFSYKTGLREG